MSQLSDNPVPPPAPSGGNGQSWIERNLKNSATWFLIGVISSAVAATVAGMEKLDELIAKRVNTVLNSSPAMSGRLVPKGGMILFPVKCPGDWYDMTATLNGRYIFIDRSAVDDLTIYDDTGSHEHLQGEHSHSVSGTAQSPSNMEKSGSRDNLDAMHRTASLKVSGTATSDGSGHKHTGGAHEHRRVGLHLCKS